MTRNVIGLDVGGTKITGIVHDGKKVVRELTVATPRTLAGFKTQLKKLLDNLSYGKDAQAVGVGVAGIVYPESGNVQFSPNLKFLHNFKFQKFLESLGYERVHVENDANCFAYAELKLGKGREFTDFVAVTLGTGIGAGIIAGGQLYRGAHNSAGEPGHMMADFKYDSEHYFQVARNKRDYKRMGEVIGLLLANIMNVLDVEAIVLGGSISQLYHKQFLPEALKVSKVHILNKQIKLKVAVSTLKNGGALGAAMLAAEQVR